MKRLKTTLAIACLSLATLAPVAGAYAMPEGGGKGPMKEALKELDLTKDQRSAIHETFSKNGPDLRDHMKALMESREKLADVTHSAQFNETAVRDAARAVAKNEEDLAVLRAKNSAAIAAILTPDQRAKLEKKRKERMAEFKERGGKFREHGGWRGKDKDGE
jgi:Spy/CpxP family protein refolding chaperone